MDHKIWDPRFQESTRVEKRGNFGISQGIENLLKLLNYYKIIK
jgi:hypothetical protein